MIGDAEIYDLLHWYDEDFRKIFKIKADFDHNMPNTTNNMTKLAGFVARICKEEDLLPCDASGMGAIAKLSIRWGGRKKKVTAQFDRIADLIREADIGGQRGQFQHNIEQLMSTRLIWTVSNASA